MKAKNVKTEQAAIEGEFLDVAETNLPQTAQVHEIARPEPEQPNNIYRLIEIAIEKGAGMEQLEKLMDLYARHEAAQAKKAFLLAKTALQSALPIVRKLKTASFEMKGGGVMSYSYASLDDVTETIKPYLKEHGFSYRWSQSFEGTAIRVQCVLTHHAGHSEVCDMVGAADGSGHKNPLQAVASGIQYMRRNTLTGVLGLATADEDIDGRLPSDGPPAPTDSETLNGLLEHKEAELIAQIKADIAAADNVATLKEAGNSINSLSEGKAKDAVKNAYMTKLKELKNGVK